MRNKSSDIRTRQDDQMEARDEAQLVVDIMFLIVSRTTY